MATHKYKLLKVEKSLAEKLGDKIVKHGPLVVWGTLTIIIVLTLLILQVSAREDFLLQYGSA